MDAKSRLHLDNGRLKPLVLSTTLTDDHWLMSLEPTLHQ